MPWTSREFHPQPEKSDDLRTATPTRGISAGWADVYGSHLACQFIVLDNLPDGDYTLQSTTNTQHLVEEDCYGDNAIWTGLRFTRDEARRALDEQGLFHEDPVVDDAVDLGTWVARPGAEVAPPGSETVELIDPPFVPEDRIRFDRGNVAAVRVGWRWKVVEAGTHWMLDSGYVAAGSQRAVQVINHYRLSYLCFVGRPTCGGVRPMQYWLTDEGEAPSGELEGEECVSFDPAALTVEKREERWGVAAGSRWLHDFGPAGEGNAIAALHFIRKYGFDRMCHVFAPRLWWPWGSLRPTLTMTYFKRSQ